MLRYAPVLLTGLALHVAIHVLRPMADALFSDMAINEARASLVRDGFSDLHIAFQSLGEPLTLAGIMHASAPHREAVYGILTCVHIAAWLGGGLALRGLCAAWAMSERARLACVIVYAGWLPSALYSNLCLNESLAASLLLIGSSGWLSGRRVGAMVGGLALGTACLFRPNLLPFVMGLIMLTAWSSIRAAKLDRPVEDRFSAPWFIAASLVSVALAFGATGLVVPGSHGLASSDAMNFYLAVAPVRGVEFATGEGWVPVVNHLLYSEMEVANVDMTNRAYFFERAVDRIQQFPIASVVRWMRNGVESTGYRIAYFPGLPGANWLLKTFSVCSALLTLAGAVAAWRRRREPVAQLTLVAIVTMWATVTFFMGCPRARFPFDGIFIVAGIAGITSLAPRLGSRDVARAPDDPAS